MKMLLTAAVAALGLAGLAFADGHGAHGPAGHVYDVTDGENTWQSTFAEDGGYANSYGSEGTWTYEGGTLCLQVESPEGPQEICNAWEDMAVGESITTTDWSAEGTELTITRIS